MLLSETFKNIFQKSKGKTAVRIVAVLKLKFVNVGNFFFSEMILSYFCQTLKKKMSLIKSISGIRGTIGGKVNDNLTPLDVVKFASAFGTWLQNNKNKKDLTLLSEEMREFPEQMVNSLVTATLQGLGINVVDLGLSTTPTVEVMVPN
jgi:phosphomannomutase